MLFGKKKKDLPAGVRMMHYEGLRGFSQDGPCFMEQTEAGLVFQQVNGPAATLPLEKVTGLEMMPERNFMARYPPKRAGPLCQRKPEPAQASFWAHRHRTPGTAPGGKSWFAGYRQG